MLPTTFEEIFHRSACILGEGALIERLRKSYKDYSRKVVIGGIMSCKGDAYDRNKALNIDAAYAFHA